jgi:opacity protein-like surface antigen
MKTLTIVSVLATLAVPAFAGPPAPPSKAVVVPPPPVYGTGWYGAIQAGINAHQNVVDDGDVRLGGFRFSLEDNSDVGVFAGGKFGYVFGTGFLRPAVELDAFYNHFDPDVHIRGAGRDIGVGGDVDSGAFLANFLLRFNFGRFQPYVGGGVGVHHTELNDPVIRIGGRSFEGSGGDTTDFAWQIVGGADYYFTEKFSLFLEYKYLNYEGTGGTGFEDRIDQHLVGLGLRLHF